MITLSLLSSESSYRVRLLFFPVVVWFENEISNTHRDNACLGCMRTTDRVSRRCKSSFLSLRYERYAMKGESDISVKLGGYGSNRENAKPSRYSQRSCRLLPRTSSRDLKIASPCLSIPDSEAVGGLQSPFQHLQIFLPP